MPGNAQHRTADTAYPAARAVQERTPLTTTQVLALQRSIGNAAVVRLRGPQWRIHDASSATTPVPQGEPAAPSATVLAPTGQRSIVSNVLCSAEAPRASLCAPRWRRASGADFTEVRPHDDAARSAAEVSARAYASGDHVVLGREGADKHTLAHELTHAIQQRSGPVVGIPTPQGITVSDPLDRFEREVEATATRVLASSVPARQAEVPARPAHPGPGTMLQRAPANPKFTEFTENYPTSMTEGEYLPFVDASISHSAPMAFIVNAILPHSDVRHIPAVIESILANYTSRPQRVGVVLGINAKKGDEKALEAAVANAQTLIASVTIPVALVHSTFTGDFPFGRMRNEVLHSPECLRLTSAFALRGMHPYISMQDFDTGSRQVRGGAHVFDYFEAKLNSVHETDEDPHAGGSSSRPASSNSPSSSASSSSHAATSGGTRLPPTRPLMIAGGYRLATSTDEFIAAVRSRYPKGSGARIPEWLVPMPSTEKLNAMGKKDQEVWKRRGAEQRKFIDEFSGLVDRDMRERDHLAAIHPLLPYAPEPNLLFDALPNVLRHGSLHFGDAGAEFTKLAMRINEFNAWELHRRFVSQYQSAETRRLHEDITNLVRINAENCTLPERGPAVVTDFFGGAISTDLSRLAYQYLTGGSLPQSHLGLTDLIGRYFSASSGNPRKAKTGVKLSDYRDRYELANKDTYMKQETLRRKGLPSLPSSSASESGGRNKKRPKASEKQLGPNKRQEMGHNISAPLPKPFDSISVGISPQHKIAAARELALSTSKFRLGRTLAYVKFDVLDRGTPMDGNCLYHAVHQARTGESANQAAAEKLRSTVVDWALQDDNLALVNKFAENFGADTGELINTIVCNGNWAGPAGDLAPRMLASALGVTIVIYPDNAPPVTLEPLTGEGTETLHIDLENQHYSVRHGTNQGMPETHQSFSES